MVDDKLNDDWDNWNFSDSSPESQSTPQPHVVSDREEMGEKDLVPVDFVNYTDGETAQYCITLKRKNQSSSRTSNLTRITNQEKQHSEISAFAPPDLRLVFSLSPSLDKQQDFWQQQQQEEETSKSNSIQERASFCPSFLDQSAPYLSLEWKHLQLKQASKPARIIMDPYHRPTAAQQKTKRNSSESVNHTTKLRVTHTAIPRVQNQNAHPHDVLLGRGKAAASWPGNQRYQALIKHSVGAYEHASKNAAKLALTRQIVATVTSEGGRFLKLTPHDTWVPISLATARVKVAQVRI